MEVAHRVLKDPGQAGLAPHRARSAFAVCRRAPERRGCCGAILMEVPGASQARTPRCVSLETSGCPLCPGTAQATASPVAVLAMWERRLRCRGLAWLKGQGGIYMAEAVALHRELPDTHGEPLCYQSYAEAA